MNDGDLLIHLMSFWSMMSWLMFVFGLAVSYVLLRGWSWLWNKMWWKRHPHQGWTCVICLALPMGFLGASIWTANDILPKGKPLEEGIQYYSLGNIVNDDGLFFDDFKKITEEDPAEKLWLLLCERYYDYSRDPQNSRGHVLSESLKISTAQDFLDEGDAELFSKAKAILANLYGRRFTKSDFYNKLQHGSTFDTLDRAVKKNLARLQAKQLADRLQNIASCDFGLSLLLLIAVGISAVMVPLALQDIRRITPANGY
jgi:hypothetical protein